MRSTQCPKRSGKYIVRCMETNQGPQPVRVFKFKGSLWVDDPEVGKNPIDHYHDNLTDITWEKVK